MQKWGFVLVFAELHEITGGLFPQLALFTVDCSYAFLHISWDVTSIWCNLKTQ